MNRNIVSVQWLHFSRTFFLKNIISQKHYFVQSLFLKNINLYKHYVCSSLGMYVAHSNPGILPNTVKNKNSGRRADPPLTLGTKKEFKKNNNIKLYYSRTFILKNNTCSKRALFPKTTVVQYFLRTWLLKTIISHKPQKFLVLP